MEFIVNIIEGRENRTYKMSHPDVAWNPETVEENLNESLNDPDGCNDLKDLLKNMRKRGWDVDDVNSTTINFRVA